MAIIICLFVSALLVHLINNNTDQLINTLPWVITPEDLVFIPWFICLSAIMIRSIQDVTLTTTATAISFLLWSIEYFQPMLFPSAMLFIIVSTIYLLSILFDSYALAYRDELTGLPSRRALYNLVLSLGPKYTVAMSDIDHFKKFNDTYGHDVGDQVLKLVSSKLSKISGGGKVFRYGGEEFTIVFPRKSAEETLNHLETVRQTIEDYQIILRDEKRKKGDKKSRSQASNTNKTVSVTISIGAANKVRGENFEHALKQADIALYKAKKQGRNQVCI
ncbi:GGDEF domain-containing protein [Parashewanella spongiae]|uniref:GGDEF domain-containing protein n=1 Tax=Parashewanella spongiae TaxID=342950 RepID=UPI001FB33BCE|nr:GGDEF domain-containing protein [Parashewanella spongiae]MCL1079672.1 GGDEF domain-containing protein [Parashewanella spongiae]